MIAFLDFFNKYVFGALTPVLLLASGIYFSFRLKFFHLLHPLRILKTILTKSEGSGTSPFRALTVALAGTLGVGNIAGVALAIVSGGPGAIFWMWISALAAMIIKYAEIALAVHYRKKHAGEVNGYYGGAMYYIREGLGNTKLSRILAAVFAVLCIFNSISMGSVIQISVIAESLEGRLGVPSVTTGIAIAILTAIVVCGGAKSISGLTVRLVPFMSIVYVMLSMYIILANLGELPRVFGMIIESAFTPGTALGGIGGFFLSRSMRYGVARGLLSNEAGCGTAPIAHAASNTKSAAVQGLWGIVEVFVDTILLCSMTAFVILISYDAVSAAKISGIMLTIKAFEFTFGDAAGIIICAAVLLFAFATIICWAFYGSECVAYFTRSHTVKTLYLAVYCASVLFGAVAASNFIWSLADFAICGMMTVNTSCILFMSNKVVELSKDIIKADAVAVTSYGSERKVVCAQKKSASEAPRTQCSYPRS